MATCNNCGHTQSDFLSSADIESIQFNSILVQDKCQKMENENASLRAMLKTESDQHHARVQELLNKFEAELGRLKEKNDAGEAEKLQRENEILRSSVYELNLKVNGTNDLIKDLKAQLVHALEDADRLKEVLKNNCDYIRGLETQLLEAIDRADHLEEAALARNEDDAASGSSAYDDDETSRPKMSLDMQLEESFDSSLQRIKNIFIASNGKSENSSAEDSSNASRDSVSSEASIASKESSASEMSSVSKESATTQSSGASSGSSFHSSSSGESDGSKTSSGSSVESSSSSKMSSGSSGELDGSEIVDNSVDGERILFAFDNFRKPTQSIATSNAEHVETANAEPDDKDEELSDGFVDLVF